MKDLLKEKYRQLKVGDKSLYLMVCIDKYDDDILLDKIASAISGGVDIIELSSLNSAARLLALSKKVKILCQEFDVTLILKDRIDVAFLMEADGVSLDSNSLDLNSVRQILGDNILIGSYSDVNDDYDFLILELPETCTNIPVFSIYNANLSDFRKIAVSDAVMDSESPQNAADKFKKLLNL